MSSWIVSFLLATMRDAVPLIFAALGILLAERAGVLNIGVEGQMLAGALTAVVIAVLTQNVWIAVVAASLTGAVIGVIQSFFTVYLPADQIVVGIAINGTCLGLTSFIYKITIDKGMQLIAPGTLQSIAPGLKDVPVIGFFASWSPLAYIAIVAVVLMYLFLFRTGPGLLLRSAGESAHAAHAAGLNVTLLRTIVLCAAGSLCGLGGAALGLAVVRSFTDNLTMGRGFIALAAVYFARWNPLLAFGACLLFGAGEALAFRAQAAGVGLNPYYYLMLPYVMTLIAVGLFGKGRGPRDAGKPYLKG